MQLKITVKMTKSIIHQKRPSKMMKTFINYSRKKTRIDIVGDSVANGIEEKRMNKTNQFNIKVHRYPEAF